MLLAKPFEHILLEDVFQEDHGLTWMTRPGGNHENVGTGEGVMFTGTGGRKRRDRVVQIGGVLADPVRHPGPLENAG